MIKTKNNDDINDVTKPAAFRVTILGSGSSGGVPRPGGVDGLGDWGVCDPKEPKNRRSRCSMLIERAHETHGFAHDHVTSVIVDTAPDMRLQLMAAGCSRLDGVLYTHAHADQSNGIDDLRLYAIAMRSRIPVWIDDDTAGELIERFNYCFEKPENSSYPAILDRQVIPPIGSGFEVNGPAGIVPVMTFLQYHGRVNSLGFRFGDIAYSSDLVDLPEASFEALEGVKIWIVDALQMKPHGSHAHLDLTLEWIERVKPERAILTNLHISMDYQTLKNNLPMGVEPAYDGMRIDC